MKINNYSLFCIVFVQMNQLVAMDSTPITTKHDTTVQRQPFTHSYVDVKFISRSGSNMAVTKLQIDVDHFSTVDTLKTELELKKNFSRYAFSNYLYIVTKKINIFEELEEHPILLTDETLSINKLINRHKSSDFKFEICYDR